MARHAARFGEPEPVQCLAVALDLGVADTQWNWSDDAHTFLTDNFPPEVNAPASRTFEHCREWVAAWAARDRGHLRAELPRREAHRAIRN